MPPPPPFLLFLDIALYLGHPTIHPCHATVKPGALSSLAGTPGLPAEGQGLHAPERASRRLLAACCMLTT